MDEEKTPEEGTQRSQIGKLNFFPRGLQRHSRLSKGWLGEKSGTPVDRRNAGKQDSPDWPAEWGTKLTLQTKSTKNRRETDPVITEEGRGTIFARAFWERSSMTNNQNQIGPPA